MRVSITPIESHWLLPKPTAIRLLARLELDRDEDILVRHFGFQEHIILARPPTYIHEPREIIGECGKPQKVFEKIEIDNNVRLSAFLRGDVQWQFTYPTEVNLFVLELREGFRKFKDFLVANGSPVEGVVFDV